MAVYSAGGTRPKAVLLPTMAPTALQRRRGGHVVVDVVAEGAAAIERSGLEVVA
jgi:hypothetical protein